MIKPINISRIGMEPIKVPRQNNISFSGLSVSSVKKASQKILGKNAADKLVEIVKPVYLKAKPIAEKASKKIVGFARQVPEYITKAGKFIKDNVVKLFRHISKSIKDSKDITKNSGKKGRTLRNIALAVGATTAGAGGISHARHSENKNKKGS